MTAHIIDAFKLAAKRWRWRKAHDLEDLANLQADRITNTLADWRNDDRRPMYAALVALGRAGVVITDWRPGTVSVDGRMETRACFTGFADDETKDWLDNLMYYAAKDNPAAVKYVYANVWEAYAPGCLEYDRFDGDDSARNHAHAGVERIDGATTAYLGEQLTHAQIDRAFPTKNSGLRDELRKAWQIMIVAPTWGDGQMFADFVQMIYADANSDQNALVA